MKREEVYRAINSEREFQDRLIADTKNHPEMVDIGMGDSIGAIQYNLNQALNIWYKEATPYPETMNYIRKIAALAVRCGEKFEMPKRD